MFFSLIVFMFNPVERYLRFINILSSESFAYIYHIFPATFVWVWRKYICNAIKTIQIQVTTANITKTAYLNIHGDFKQIDRDKEICPVLLSHGDFGHPWTMLHLVDIAKKEGQPTFSLYIPGVDDNDHFDMFDNLLEQALEKIEEIVREKCGGFSGILVAGHSKGSILLAQRHFVVGDSRIKATCAIGGRLHIPHENACNDNLLKIIVRHIHKGILKNSTFPLMQIVPRDDWNASYESMAVRPHDHCHTVPGMHLSGLYSLETRTHFTQFLRHFIPKIANL
jgi:hypothetical protein